ncbi:hypothetical protein [Streptomyces sp. NPDC126499]|uniref:hypothetical protein n=1 Tax=Streptomyces sp. NPDC126499 TaxID=3155314 RepID=UPI00331B91A2
MVQGLLVLAAGLLATAALGQAVTHVYDTVFADERLRDEDEAQQRLDQAEAPFTAAVDPDLSTLDSAGWTIVLDRALTPAEQHSLKAVKVRATVGYGRDVWRILGPLGARVIGSKPFMEAGPFSMDGPTTTFKLHLFSGRSSQLAITEPR